MVLFWQCVLENPHLLSEKVKNYYPLQKNDFYLHQKKQFENQNKYDRAAIYYVLNRSSFSGSTLSGGMSPGHPRFTISSIQRLKNFYNPNLVINKSDFEKSMAQHPHAFAYLDPPYLIKNKLYGYKGNTHKSFDHKRLQKVLEKRENWLLSYNDCIEIRNLYKGYHILTPNWKYGMSSNKQSNEVLVFSKNFRIKGEYFY